MSAPPSSKVIGEKLYHRFAQTDKQRKLLESIDHLKFNLIDMPYQTRADMNERLDEFVTILGQIRSAKVSEYGEMNDGYIRATWLQGEAVVKNMAESMRKHLGQEEPSDLASMTYPKVIGPLEYHALQKRKPKDMRRVAICRLLEIARTEARDEMNRYELSVMRKICREGDSFSTAVEGDTVDIPVLSETEMDESWKAEMFQYWLFALFGIAKTLSEEKGQEAMTLWNKQKNAYMEPGVTSRA